MHDSVKRHPLGGYTVVCSSDLKILEYLRNLRRFKYDRRRTPPTAELFPGYHNASGQWTNEWTAPFHRLEALGRYKELCERVALAKVLWALKELGVPVIVEVVLMFVKGLNGFPGHLTEDIEQAVSHVGSESVPLLLNMVRDPIRMRGENRAIVITTLAAICGLNGDVPIGLQFRHSRVEGKIVNPQGGEGWPAIFQPEGSDSTLSQLTLAQRDQFAMRARLADELRANPFIDPREFGC